MSLPKYDLTIMNGPTMDASPHIIIPAYNEAATIRPLIQRVLQVNNQVTVVNDGSTDETATQLADLPITLLNNPHNLGKGPSLVIGMQQALNHRATAVITLDADNQHDPADIPQLIAAHHRYPNHIIIAARMKNRNQAPLHRRVANKIADFFISWACNKAIIDSQSGFRLYPKSFLQQYNLDPSQHQGFAFESEILIDASQQGFNIALVPIDTLYFADARPSHFRTWQDSWAITRLILQTLLKHGFRLAGLFNILRRRRPIIFQ